MALTLTIRNSDRLENGSPLALVLDRRGGLIGRAQTSDWCLPDPSLHISSRHCEIAFRDGSYVLTDVSTNGTYLNGSETRLPEPHVLRQGDVFAIGQFEIAVVLDGMPAAQAPPPAPPGWQGWEAGASSGPAAAPASAGQWDRPPPASAISGVGPMSQNWAPPQVDPGQPGAGGWGGAPQPAAGPASSWAPQAPAPAPASGWSSPIPAQAPPPSADDVWGRIAASNVVDWARGGFGAGGSAPAIQPFAPSAAPGGGDTYPGTADWQQPAPAGAQVAPTHHPQPARHPPRRRSTCTRSKPRWASRQAICSRIRTRPWRKPQPCCGGSLPGWS